MSPASPQGRSARSAAVAILARWQQTGEFPDRLIPQAARDRAFLVEMVYGIARWKRQLDWFIRRLVPRRPDAAIMPFLWVGLYQLLRMDHVAEHAAVHETVEAAKSTLNRREAGFLNGVLRTAIRRKESLLAELAKQSAGIRTSHPDILLKRWAAAYGTDTTAALCDWNNRPAPTILHPDARRLSVAAYLDLLRNADIHGSPHPADPVRCIELSHGVAIAALPEYKAGGFSVQDPSTFAAVDLLATEPGDQVLDACAAPGGKTALIAERMDGRGTLVAMDTHDDRLATVRENMNRMNHPWVRLVRGDATRPNAPAGLRQFSRILADVPCTNTGVLRRRPDARWRFSAERLSKMTRTQRAILDGLAPLLAPGGRLVYSTCSLEPEEGEWLISKWLTAHPDFQAVESVRLVPPLSGTDGIYAMALARKA